MKPRILITGCNKQQCNRLFYLRQQLKVVPAQYALYNCLIDMGYEVDQREVALGENLDSYDHVIVYLAAPRQMVAGFAYQGLWAISQRPDCVIAFDDWQVESIFKGMASCENENELLADFVLGVNATTRENVLPYVTQLTEAVRTIIAMKNRVLLCAFDTTHLGDHQTRLSRLFGALKYPVERLFSFNPNPYHRNRDFANYWHVGPEAPEWPQFVKAINDAIPIAVSVIKRDRFNFASLVQSRTAKWLKLMGASKDLKTLQGWPLDVYGSKAQGQTRLTEDQMWAVFASDWGCLMPSYEHAGSGWWRARPLQTADGGSILIGNWQELEVYYGHGNSVAALTPRDVVEASVTERQQLAHEQSMALHKQHPLDGSVTKAELLLVLEAAA